MIVAGAGSGYFSATEEREVIDRVARGSPDLLFVALDVPRQDGWIRRNLSGLGSKVSMGVGGSFDVISGRLKRAPRWMQSAGLEWFFRLTQEPRRAWRMRGLPVFLSKILADRFFPK